MRQAIRTETVLITVMQPTMSWYRAAARGIGCIAAESDVYFHTDAVQSAGKLPIDVNVLRLDLLALSGHKFYGPKGVGALYIRGGTRLQQLLYGGHHQRDSDGYGERSWNCRLGQGRGDCREVAGGRCGAYF